MSVFIALYRGINVAGKNSVSMESLRKMHERLGHLKVQSYIQSGNIVFRARGSAGAIAGALAGEFAKVFGFEARLMVVDARQWRRFIAENPYAKIAAKNHKVVHAGICAGKPDAKQLKALLAKTGGSETFVAGNGIVYLYAPDGFGTSKFAAGMERAAGVAMTLRNWRTMQTLGEIASQIQ